MSVARGLNHRGRCAAALASLAILLYATAGAAGQPPPVTPSPRPPPAPPAPAPGPPVSSVAQPVEALEGRPIARVVIRHPVEGKPGEFEALTPSLEQLARNQVRSGAGTPLSGETVAQDISRLNRIGRFRMIRVEARGLADGSAELVYTLSEQPVVQDVQVVGNRVLSDQELLAGVAVISGAPVDRFQIDRGARAIEEMYRAKGYYAARVQTDPRALDESAIVLFRVIEGEQVKVTAIRFEGNTSFVAKDLRAQIKTTTAIPVIEKAPLDDLVLADDVSELVKFYRDRGYLDARASVRTQVSPNGREALVVFQVEEGPLYTLRSVQALYQKKEDIARYKAEVLKDPQADLTYLTPEQMRQIGLPAYTSEQVSGLMVIKPGDVYSDDKLRVSMDLIREAYGKRGYLLDSSGPSGPITVGLTQREVRDESKPEVDLLLFITEGTPYRTGEVTVTGNDLTKQQVILRQVEVRPERPLDKTALDETRRRLEELRLFEPGSVRVTAQPPRPGDPGHRDVGIEVAETNTGEVNFGVAVGADEGVLGRFAIVQRNFDIADTPESFGEMLSGRAFRGTGQRLDLEVLPGTESQTFLLSLTEPYLFESNYLGTVTGLYRRRQFDEYDEERYGGVGGIGRRFGNLWKGNLTLRYQWVALSNIQPDAPVDYFASEDLHPISGVGIDLTRTTVDSATRPSRGSVISVAAEQVGAAGGDWDFTKLSQSYTGFFSLYQSFLGYRTMLKLEERVAYIPQGQKQVPVYERYYLGGQNFRGFAFRGVSPRSVTRTGQPSNDPVGGTFSYFMGAELNQPVYQDVLSVVTFVDTGTVDTHFGFSNYRASVGVGLRIYVRQLSPVPLAFDLGFPVLKQTGDKERVFTFSIDVPY